jgi:predicted Zn-dependent protease
MNNQYYLHPVKGISLLGIVLFLILGMSMNGCKTMETVTGIGTSIGVATGVIDQSHAESIQKSSKAVAYSFQDITPEQEYYIGRTVGAVVVNKYKPYDNPKANRYINVIGQTLAQASDLPETFNGYHFLILDSDEINAFATPGGLIFVTRGMLRCCLNENAVAAVLAHEIGHVQERHGLQSIKKARVTTALTTLALEGTKTFSGANLADLVDSFEGSISDITSTMINNGYSREFEEQADQAAVNILKRVGYNPNALIEMLRVMETRLKPGGVDFAKTHPSPDTRINAVEESIDSHKIVNRSEARQKRFAQFLGGI